MSVALVASAALRRHARTILAGLAADRLAHARVRRFITVIAGARSRRCARPENARLVALGFADEWLVYLIAGLAHAHVRGCAMAVAARAFADGLAREWRGIVASLPVTGPARAHVRLGAVSVILLAFRVADGPAGVSVRIQPIALVATANLGIDAGAVDATVRAFRYARTLAVVA